MDKFDRRSFLKVAGATCTGLPVMSCAEQTEVKAPPAPEPVALGLPGILISPISSSVSRNWASAAVENVPAKPILGLPLGNTYDLLDVIYADPTKNEAYGALSHLGDKVGPEIDEVIFLVNGFQFNFDETDSNPFGSIFSDRSELCEGDVGECDLEVARQTSWASAFDLQSRSRSLVLPIAWYSEGYSGYRTLDDFNSFAFPEAVAINLKYAFAALRTQYIADYLADIVRGIVESSGRKLRVSFIGHSLGTAVILRCLLNLLEARDFGAIGAVDKVILMSGAAPQSLKNDFLKAAARMPRGGMMSVYNIFAPGDFAITSGAAVGNKIYADWGCEFELSLNSYRVPRVFRARGSGGAPHYQRTPVPTIQLPTTQRSDEILGRRAMETCTKYVQRTIVEDVMALLGSTLGLSPDSPHRGIGEPVPTSSRHRIWFDIDLSRPETFDKFGTFEPTFFKESTIWNHYVVSGYARNAAIVKKLLDLPVST